MRSLAASVRLVRELRFDQSRSQQGFLGQQRSVAAAKAGCAFIPPRNEWPFGKMLRAEGWRIAALPTEGNVISLSSIVDFLSGGRHAHWGDYSVRQNKSKTTLPGEKRRFPTCE